MTMIISLNGRHLSIINNYSICNRLISFAIQKTNFCTKKRQTTIRLKETHHGHQLSNSSLDPKSVILNFYQLVCNHFNNPSLKPTLVAKNLSDNKAVPLWQVTLNLTWPSPLKLEGLGKQIKHAESKVFGEAVLKLKKLKLLSFNGKPQIIAKNERQLLRRQWTAPQPISLSSQAQEKIQEFINDKKMFEEELKTECLNKFIPASDQMIDVFTGMPFREFDENEITNRNQILKQQLKQRELSINPHTTKILEDQESLPISSYKEKIINLINENQVVIVSGETGCGKTTQVPQFILDEYAKRSKGVACNIVITQPRRLSAITIAERVAYEREEKVGTSVGYHVRLKSKLPWCRGGVLLFCTTGILLRQLQSNPLLAGISHIIIDEAHERDIMIDFTLARLKEILSKNTELRLIIMSASINVEKFSAYFNQSPTIHVPGHVHPVQDIYLGQIIETGFSNDFNFASRNFDARLVTEAITWIHANRPPGAILCFLPGWQEIQGTYDHLKELDSDLKKELVIHCVHSRLSHNDQSLIFNPPIDKRRKVILSTNITETSITIDDIVYVIDSGLHKQKTFDPHLGISSLSSTWVTQANIKQRRGRAGRTRPGEYYHFIPKALHDKLELYPLPEIQRSSLESVVLDTKIHCPHYKRANEFLALLPDPPSEFAVTDAVRDLKQRGFLTSDEDLTPLGMCAASFSLHPYLAKTVLYSMWLRCADPILTIVSYLASGAEPFIETLENKDEIKRIKKKYENSSGSDHIMLLNLFNEWLWQKDENATEYEKFCVDNFINKSKMEFILSMKNSLEKQCQNLLDDWESENSSIIDCNKHKPMITAILSAGFFPNYARCVQGELCKSKLKPNSLWFKDRKGGKVRIPPSSVNYSSKSHALEKGLWLTFPHKLRLSESGLTLIKDSSVILPLSILFFSTEEITVKKLTHDELLYKDDNIDSHIDDMVILCINDDDFLRFICSKRAAEQILCLRKIIHFQFQSFLQNLVSSSDNQLIIHHMVDKDLLDVIVYCLQDLSMKND